MKTLPFSSSKAVTTVLAMLGFGSAVARADIVLDWNTAALEAVVAQDTSSPVASRNMAILQASIYDAVNGIDGGYTPFYFSATGTSGASIEAAAATAANTVMQSLYPSLAGSFTSLYDSQISSLADTQARSDGVAWGQQVATAYLSWRGSDGASSAASVPYVVNGTGGRWLPTAPSYSTSPLLPGWGEVVPFGMTSSTQFTTGASSVVAGPPALSSVAYANDYNEVKSLGISRPLIRADLSVDDTMNIAQFWEGGIGTVTTPGMWNQLAQTYLTNSGSDIRTKARVLAALSVALADAGISAWDAKYQHDFWRPESAIAYGGDAFDDSFDHNPLTEGSGTWTPLLTTPLTPEYVSERSAFSSAAGDVLKHYFGNAFFTLGSDTDGDGIVDMTRSFSTLDAAVNEAALSGVYSGTEFGSATTDGKLLGKTVASWTVTNYFLPVPEPSSGLLAAASMLLLARRRRSSTSCSRSTRLR